MSIVACVKVYDGMVVGSESMTQLFGSAVPGQPSNFVKAYSNARKLFEIAGTNFGVLTYGAGNIGSRSIGSYLSEFSDSEGHERDTGEQIARKLLTFIQTPYDATFGALMDPPVLGFYVAGYSPGEHTGTEWEFVLGKTPTVPTQPRPENQFGASWRGVAAPFSRLHFGADPRLLPLLETSGVPAATLQVIQNALLGLASPVAFDGMPLQDAIGYCKFVIETTIGQSTYEVGVASCGGPIHLAIITRKDGFSWISAPKLSL